MSTKTQPQNLGNRRARRAMKRNRPQHRRTDAVYSKDVVVCNDDSYKDQTKRVFSSGIKQARERIAEMKKTFRLPTRINTLRAPGFTTCVIINRDGRTRDFLPDIKPIRKILVTKSVASHMVSGVCMLTRPTANYNSDNLWLDGSWAITPAEYRMLNVTTVQHVRRRSWWFLRRYPYEISFDGRVNPAHLLFDYELDPAARRTKLYLTTETVKVKGQDGVTNTYFRFWKHKPLW